MLLSSILGKRDFNNPNFFERITNKKMENFAWPIAIIILGFGFMLLFRKSLDTLLSRTKKLGKSGLETFYAPQLPAPKEEDNEDALTEFMGSYENPLLREFESHITEDLMERGLTDSDAAQRVLVRSLAGLQIVLIFEHIQVNIWASQVKALTHLNTCPQGSTFDEINSF